MNYLYYDSGTTNTRLYLFKDLQLIDSSNKKIGSRDSALSGSNKALLCALREMMDEMCEKHGLSPEQIEEIWMSGMISSPTGIVEIHHLCVPVTLSRLKENVTSFFEASYFQRTIFIIPGVKTTCAQPISLENFHSLNNMRGEETEIFGILQSYPALCDNCIMIMPGSHTQIAQIRNGAITDIISTITGELYSAVKNNTILSTSLPASLSEAIEPELLCRGYENLNVLGFNRALYTVRTMELFMETTPAQRHSYFEGILNGGVLNVIFRTYRQETIRNIAVYGSEESIGIFRILFEKYYPKCTFTGISSQRAVPFSVNGFLSIKCCKTM